jgi:hypothetical protein
MSLSTQDNTKPEEKQIYIHASRGIRTHYPSVLANEEISYFSMANVIDSILHKALNLILWVHFNTLTHIAELWHFYYSLVTLVYFIATDYVSDYLKSFIHLCDNLPKYSPERERSPINIIGIGKILLFHLIHHNI